MIEKPSAIEREEESLAVATLLVSLSPMLVVPFRIQEEEDVPGIGYLYLGPFFPLGFDESALL
jgi:hypothetical protein